MMDGYKSPIEIVRTITETQVEGEILKAVWKVGVNVDRDELLKALQYDRGQYEKGLRDAVKHGRWLSRPKNEGWEDEEITVIGMVNGEPWASCYCSECGKWLVASDEYNVKGYYCPNCGAKMEAE